MARRSRVVASLLRASLLRRLSPCLSEQSISSSAPCRLSFGWFDKVKSAFTGKPSADSSASKIAFSLTEVVDQMDFAILHYLGAIDPSEEDLFANGNAQEKKGSKRSFVEESLFSWFNENLHKNLSEGLMDEVAEIIIEDLWPNPLKYFNNEIDEDDFDGEDDEEETDGDYGEDDDGEQDDDDEEDEDQD